MLAATFGLGMTTLIIPVGPSLCNQYCMQKPREANTYFFPGAVRGRSGGISGVSSSISITRSPIKTGGPGGPGLKGFDEDSPLEGPLGNPAGSDSGTGTGGGT